MAGSLLLYNIKTNFSANYKFHESDAVSVLEDSSMDLSLFKNILIFHNNQNREIELCSKEDFFHSDEDQSWVFTVKDVVSFLCKTGEKIIYYKLYEKGTNELLHYWLAHTLMPIFLTLERNYFFFHVGAVSVDNKPIVFMADSYGGKSTLTNCFIQNGHSLITDDKLATFEKDEKFYLAPSYPFHRPYREMETLGIPAKNFEKEITLIDCIYILSKSDPKAAISISRLKGIEKFKQLKLGTEVDFSFLFKKRVEYISKLAKQVNVYNVTIPWNIDRLEDVYNAIIQHQKYLTTGEQYEF